MDSTDSGYGRRSRDREARISRFISIVSCVASVLTLLGGGLIYFFDTGVRLGKLESSVSTLEVRVSKISDKLDETRSMVDQLWGATSTELHPTNSFSTTIRRQYNDIDAPVIDTDSPLSSDSIIGTDVDTGTELSVSDVAGKTLLLYSSTDGVDSYFLGQIDNNGNWDGNCIYNSYQNGKLTFITETQYQNGKLIHYEQVFTYTTSNLNDKVWAVSDRTVELGDIRTGETSYYFRTGVFEQRFETDDVEASDIVTVDNFRSYLSAQNAKMEGYYFGRSKDGRFNDDTGTSYMVKYYEDGNVRTIYYGNFVDGQFNDQTGNAWEIAFSTVDNCYYFYAGTFTNGYADSDEEPIELTESKLKSLLSGKTFNCPLTGLQ